MSEPTHYDPAFYESQRSGSLGSAKRIVPLVIDLLRPASVLDVGCGTGTWLSEFAGAGVKDIQGLDGSYVRREQLLIERAQFKEHDLRTPFNLGRRFDLVMSLEVAEHLPPATSDAFVKSLAAHGSAVLFGAAIPHQGGTDHINEQWQHAWAERFVAAGYVPVDCLRRKVWADPQVESFYAQNMILYVLPSVLEQHPHLAADRVDDLLHRLSVVHPSMWKFANHPNRLVVSQLARLLVRNLSRSVAYRFGRLKTRLTGRPYVVADEGYLTRAKF